MSLTVEIVKVLSKLGTGETANPDSKHNQGRLLGEAFMWDEVEKYAKAKSRAAWDALGKTGIIPKKEDVEDGETEVGFSPHFLAITKASKPVRRFNAEALMTALARGKYKVPKPYAAEQIDKAKVPGDRTISYKIVEKS